MKKNKVKNKDFKHFIYANYKVTWILNKKP